MPAFDRGDLVLGVERLVEADPGELEALLEMIIESCKCLVVDYPAVASVSSGRGVIDVAVGQGSLVCRGECKPLEEAGALRLSAPLHIYGRWLPEPGSEHLYAGPFEPSRYPVLRLMRWRVAELWDALELVKTSKVYGVALLSPEIDLLAFAGERRCGLPRARMPLHPASVFSKPGEEEVCVDLVRVFGPRSAMFEPVVVIDDTPLFSLIRGMGEVFVSHIDVGAEAAPSLRKMFLVGALYTIGRGG